MIGNLAHVFASAGFSGESFDIGVGYNRTFTTVAGDLVFDDTTKTLTLSAGTFPTWIRDPGVVFSTNAASNAGPFTVVSIDVTNKILTVKETVVDETPAGTTTLNGSADTGIIDVLLSAGNGALTADAPHVIVSSGALGAARTLSIAGMENETAQQGAKALNGRFFYLSIQNSDISAVNSITVSASTSINGGANVVITSAGDYLLHHIGGGIWRMNILARTSEPLATIRRIPFTAADWSAGATINQVKILQTGSPGAGEVGPHTLTPAGSYVVTVIDTDASPDEEVQVEKQFDSSGNITLVKAQKAKPFNGVAVIVGSLD